MTESPDTGLVWGVKASFVNYLAHTGDAETSVSGSAAPTMSGKFYFAAAADQVFYPDLDETTLKFCGELQFTAHLGVLNVDIRDPWVALSRAGSHLSVALPNSNNSRIPLVSIEPASAPTVDGGIAMWSALPTRLSPEGMAVFDGFYQAGEPFDPLTIRVLMR